MSNSSQFQINPSRLLLLWLCMVYGLFAIVLLAFSEMVGWPIKFFLLCITGIAGVIQTKRYVWLEGDKAIVLLQYAQNKWTIHSSTGKVHQVNLKETSLIKPWLTLLQFQCDKTKHFFPVILLSDSMNNQQFLSLRRLLKSQVGGWC